ncbi:MAG: D-3-phosphoglycerate dehydrogenase / 2-oxoglutarate reductase [Solirubrobacteraceae bacterium]|jgi:D-3-phosphoglycerate dehydrogenase|nr:D-3-phosphoglycerate dehydrogenase / 2-oxoglutarate reductase [Solirubrobacteraceae bacterium]
MTAAAAAAATSAAGTAVRPRVLVREDVGDPGVELLREHFDVELGFDWTLEELTERIGGYEGILIRSATKLTADLIARGTALRVIARAGVGVDNVDVEAATKRGIVVANAPQSNVVTAAEHTMALLLALARNIPQAHASLIAGRWDRSKFSGIELYEKTLGVLGFGRIGQLVAQRARGFGMRVVAFDPYMSAERFREVGVERVDSTTALYGEADFLTIHLPQTDDTRGSLDAWAFAAMKDGVRVINVARGGLIDDQALKDALDSGKVAGAALDVFPSEPITDYPLFNGYPNVVVTPHLGASTAEATDRAGLQSAEQLVAALTGGVVSTAVNIPSIGAEDMAVLRPFIPLAEQLGRLAIGLAETSSLERVETTFFGKFGEFDTRLLTSAVLQGALRGQTDESVNFVNAPALAEERGIVVSAKTVSAAEDFNELIRVTVVAAGQRLTVGGTGMGPAQVPHLVEVWGQRFTIELEPFVTVFRYRDLPGMLGRVGTILGAHSINIASAAVGRQPPVGSEPDEVADTVPGGGEDSDAGGEGLAAMVVTTREPVPDEVLQEIIAADGWVAARSIAL